MTRNSLVRLFAVLALTASACSGEDGANGAQGPVGPAGADGANGADGADAPAAPAVLQAQAESCVVCHAAGNDAGLDVSHALSGQVAVSTPVVSTVDTNADGVADDVVVKFNVKVDGANATGFTLSPSAYRYSAPTAAGFARATAAVTVVDDGAGNYTATLAGMVAIAGELPTSYMVRVSDAAGRRATAVAASPAGVGRDLVSDASCINCHGNNVFTSGSHHSANPQGVGACLVCHSRFDSQSRGKAGDRLTAYVHGIHNSHNMGEKTVGTGDAAVVKPAGVYARNDSTNKNNWFEVSFPGNMTNCASCHDSDARLTAIMAAPVSWSTCMSCHDGWNGFKNTAEGARFDFHRGMVSTNDCTVCHKDNYLAFATVGEVHGTRPDVMTERNGLLWKGVDQSIVEGARIEMQVVAVEAAGAGSELRVKWTAKQDGVAVDPCNADITTGPLFFNAKADADKKIANSNFSVLRAYAQGNDWVNAGVGTSPGQPASATNVTAANTTCDAEYVATTVAKVDATTAEKGIVGLQGKPQVWFADAGRAIQVRSKSPTREFVVADGSEPAAKRREIVSIDKCLACHPGTLYQHGGNRVDSIELCVMCHNPASSEQNVRESMGVTAAEAYDGKAGQTYDLRYMIHAIHSAGETGAPLVYYRSHGIYLWGDHDTAATTPNWPGTGNQLVYGSTDVQKTHNFHAVTYPRPLNDCQACHINNSEKSVPDGTMSVGITVNSGASVSDQLDDVLMGPVAATCTSCHAGGPTRAHAYSFGWTPSLIEGGREGLIGAAK